MIEKNKQSIDPELLKNVRMAMRRRVVKDGITTCSIPADGSPSPLLEIGKPFDRKGRRVIRARCNDVACPFKARCPNYDMRIDGEIGALYCVRSNKKVDY